MQLTKMTQIPYHNIKNNSKSIKDIGDRIQVPQTLSEKT